MSEGQASASAAAPSAPAADATQTTNTTSNETIGDAANDVMVAGSSPSQDSPATDQQSQAIETKTQDAIEKEIKKEIKKWQLKSGGKEREVTDEQELVRLAQLGLGANEKFEQAAKTRKEAEQVLELFQKNPTEALKRLGIDVRKFSEDFLYEELQNEKLTPEQKKMKEMEQELDKYKKEKEDVERRAQEERFQKLTSEYEASLQDGILKAIDQYKLPKNPRTVARIAEYMAKAIENGYSVDPLDVAPRVRADLEEEHRSLYSQYAVEDILKLIGEDKAKAIRQYEVDKVRAKAPQNPTKTEQVPQPSKNEEEKPKKHLTIREMMEEIEKEIK